MDDFPIWKTASAALAAIVGFKVVSYCLTVATSPLRHLQGPPAKSIIFGHLRQLREIEGATGERDWLATYGKVIQLKTILGVRAPFFRVHRI